MAKLRVESYSISLDGYGAGPEQSLKAPLGVGGESLHTWAFTTKTFQKMVFGTDAGAEGIDEEYAKRGFRNIGAWILGRNMFAHSRGPWQEDGVEGLVGESALPCPGFRPDPPCARASHHGGGHHLPLRDGGD